MKKSNSGITLVSLVITIIVMLILAGVSLSMVVGEGSILDKANTAVIETEKAGIIEEIRTILLEYNMKVRAGTDKGQTIENYLGNKVGNGIDSFQTLPLEGETKLIIKKQGYFFYVEKQGNEYVIEPMGTTLEQIESGYTVVTKEQMANNANGTMKFDLSGDESATLIFYDEINDTFNFEINGGNVTIHVTQDMMLTNKGMDRSAIKIASGATLTLNIAEGKTITVDSGFGKDGEKGSASGAKGGPGGFAGINVPVGATLNLRGKGTVVAYGGDAGDGNDSNSIYGSGGGGGAGAGIGGNGGSGGDANSTENANSGSNKAYNPTDNGKDGMPGESCGIINIYNSVTVYAYGGAGGSGGKEGSSSGSGGGGYPGAGIGGGGAGGGGGNHCDGAGGYSGGSAQYNKVRGYNGLGGGNKNSTDASSSGGGGYFSDGYGRINTKLGIAKIGGQGSGACHYLVNEQWFNDHAGSGGAAGLGGKVKVSSLAKIYAYNGDMITDGTSYSGVTGYMPDGTSTGVALSVIEKNNGTKIIPLQIFGQAGISRAVYEANYKTITKSADLENKVIKSEQVIAKSGYKHPDTESVFGVGSGAGYVETSNGTYVIDDSLNW